jgi:hypothetical protein
MCIDKQNPYGPNRFLSSFAPPFAPLGDTDNIPTP